MSFVSLIIDIDMQPFPSRGFSLLFPAVIQLYKFITNLIFRSLKGYFERRVINQVIFVNDFELIISHTTISRKVRNRHIGHVDESHP